MKERKEFEHCILLTDLDGTLLNSKKEMGEKNQKAIQSFINNGGRFGIATGRTLENVKTVLETIPTNFPSIYLNGCVLYDNEKESVIEKKTLKYSSLTSLIKECMEKWKTIMIEVYTEDMMYVITEENSSILRGHRPYKKKKLEEIKGDWLKVMFCSLEQKELLKLEEYIKSKEQYSELQYVFSDAIYLEILPENAGKGMMIPVLKQGDYVKNTDIIYTVGDYYNDISLLQNADYKIAVKNAVPKLQEMADYVTCCNEDGIIEDIVNWIRKMKTKEGIPYHKTR